VRHIDNGSQGVLVSGLKVLDLDFIGLDFWMLV